MSIWRGTHTALVTPFLANGDVDEPRLRTLVEFQVRGGVEGIVPGGTTGEGVALEPDELTRVVEVVREHAAGQVKVIAGAGGNATARVASLAKQMQRAGADAILSVVPFYNKPTPRGMREHFQRVADAVTCPVILYNVPGRTSANMRADTCLDLAQHENIVGVKEASGDLTQVMEILRGRPQGFAVLSGDDALTLPMVALGADGVISVAANQAPGPMAQMVRHALNGEWEEARKLHYRLLDLMNVNFIESNPGPVKAALAMMGLVTETYRSPMTSITDDHRRALRTVLSSLGLLPDDAR